MLSERIKKLLCFLRDSINPYVFLENQQILMLAYKIKKPMFFLQNHEIIMFSQKFKKTLCFLREPRVD